MLSDRSRSDRQLIATTTRFKGATRFGEVSLEDEAGYWLIRAAFRGKPERGHSRLSAVDDVALSVEREFRVQSTYSTGPRHDPCRTEFVLGGGRCRLHYQLLEAVFEAATAGVTSGYSFGTGLIDGGRQGTSRVLS